ncbi:MAG: hypothetical protein HFP81_02285 [Methylococcales symbiont of Hymedesmia sp. n. MRB-2018]|nr:MAG: hypothetical protein HFP78_02475 [Methylococcales symbiont of Hymedesmia sp. n. MRB-2018]KAF3984426.1 MAG: hypothetical protein HFP81_02285 [Methylococcales symbiont of Hymedesmia sp. n. MRB-2018]
MKIKRISAVVIVAVLATGCVSKSDLDFLQSQIDALKTQVATTYSSDTSKAQASVANAAAKAASAEAAANRAAQYAQDTNSKLDRMFKKLMMK